MNNFDFSDENLAQKLNFSTPQKENMFEWKLNGENTNKPLFDSPRPNYSDQVRLVMPIIINHHNSESDL